MNHFGYDMDHDGKITTKDSGVFHEMMDSEAQGDPHYGKSTWDIFGECGMLALLTLVVPIAAFKIIGWFLSIFF